MLLEHVLQLLCICHSIWLNNDTSKHLFTLANKIYTTSIIIKYTFYVKILLANVLN